MHALASRRWQGSSLSLMGCVALLAMTACGVPRRVAPDDELTSEGAIGDECKAGAVQCEAGRFRSCLNGRWRVKQSCLASQICDTQAGGCVECSPGSPAQCDG